MSSVMPPPAPPPRADRAPRAALACLLAATLAAAGCAAATATHHAQDAERRADYDLAVVEYGKALQLRPDDAGLRTGLERVKLRASEEHFMKGRRLAATGKLDEALVELQMASELNPSNQDVDENLRETREKLRAQAALPREGETSLEALIARARELPPSGDELPDSRMPASLVFRDASSRDVFTAIARFADVSLVFDPSFQPTPVTLDLRDASLRDALDAVSGATRTFYRVTAPRTIAIVPDTPAKRQEYDDEVVRTFYLSNADLKETVDLLRLVLDARRISQITATNAITIKDTPEHVTAAARLIAAIDKAKPEVIIDVELLEVNRSKLTEYGLQVASPDSAGLNGSVGAGDTLSLPQLRNLTQSDVILAGLPSLYYRLLKSDQNTRTLANPQLRASEGATAQARFGEEVPVPVTTFSPIATGGVPQQPITAFTYRTIGVNIDITPRTHHDDEVTLALHVEVSSLLGTGFGGLPTFGSRQVTTEIRLHDGETNMLAGLIRDDERHTLDGVPGLSDLPLVGRLFARSRTERTETDVILTLTPHIVRVLDLDETDLRAFRVGRDVPGGGGGGLPTPLAAQPVPPPDQEPPAPAPASQPPLGIPVTPGH
jgi:general secretion pathway protein D